MVRESESHLIFVRYKPPELGSLGGSDRSEGRDDEPRRLSADDNNDGEGDQEHDAKDGGKPRGMKVIDRLTPEQFPYLLEVHGDFPPIVSLHGQIWLDGPGVGAELCERPLTRISSSLLQCSVKRPLDVGKLRSEHPTLRIAVGSILSSEMKLIEVTGPKVDNVAWDGSKILTDIQVGRRVIRVQGPQAEFRIGQSIGHLGRKLFRIRESDSCAGCPTAFHFQSSSRPPSPHEPREYLEVRQPEDRTWRPWPTARGADDVTQKPRSAA